MKRQLVALLLAAGGLSSAFAADWVTFVDETATRLAVPPMLGANDPEEKSFAWGDLDRDGDVDLVVARKVPSYSGVARPSLLLLNENGVLTDRTATLATASDVAGDMGFATPTTSRDVAVVDVDLDGWLDVITAAVFSDGQPKRVGHPRVYRNLGCNGGVPCGGFAPWLGLRYEDARIPALLSSTGLAGQNPKFTSVSTGDVTGDGYPDLWFADQDFRDQGSLDPPEIDFNDRLLVNQGASNPGYFTDATSALLGDFDLPGYPNVLFEEARIAHAGAIVDLNGDGALDILKANEGLPPVYVGAAINSASSPGVFQDYRTAPSFSPTAVSAADLDRDGKLDLIETDDGNDRYLINQGNDHSGLPTFAVHTFTHTHFGSGSAAYDNGFGGLSRVADLDRDGWLDVLITDITAYFPGCGRRLGIYRNLRKSPGGPGMLDEQTSGTGCATPQGNPPSCLLVGIPASELEGTFDVAVFDINGDGWLDLVVGRCAGTRVFIQAPFPPAGPVPDGSDSDEALRLAKDTPLELTLTWGDSCLDSDTDYAVYSGELGAGFEDHTPLTCTTSGVSAATVPTPAASVYFLVVAHNTEAEGSYGADSAGNERSPSDSACLPQRIATCE